ncbi:MAG: hypothetical protein KGI04_01395 [Candidatus Micrarchaeota archaeon]|nr:hypothetical protein [Candidatus Micrarchaeota archaeon]
MVKTTINLDTEVYRELFKEAIHKYGTTKALSRLINEKLKGMMKRGKSRDEALERAFGSWTMKETGLQYTRRIRRESEKRVKEILGEK